MLIYVPIIQPFEVGVYSHIIYMCIYKYIILYLCIYIYYVCIYVPLACTGIYFTPLGMFQLLSFSNEGGMLSASGILGARQEMFSPFQVREVYEKITGKDSAWPGVFRVTAWESHWSKPATCPLQQSAPKTVGSPFKYFLWLVVWWVNTGHL